MRNFDEMGHKEQESGPEDATPARRALSAQRVATMRAALLCCVNAAEIHVLHGREVMSVSALAEGVTAALEAGLEEHWRVLGLSLVALRLFPPPDEGVRLGLLREPKSSTIVERAHEAGRAAFLAALKGDSE